MLKLFTYNVNFHFLYFYKLQSRKNTISPSYVPVNVNSNVNLHEIFPFSLLLLTVLENNRTLHIVLTSPEKN